MVIVIYRVHVGHADVLTAIPNPMQGDHERYVAASGLATAVPTTPKKANPS